MIFPKPSTSWRADEGAVRSHPVDHTPIVTAPDVVVDIIREAVHDVVTHGKRCGRESSYERRNLFNPIKQLRKRRKP